MQSIEIRRQKRRMRIAICFFTFSLVLGVLLIVAYMGLSVGNYTITVDNDRKVLTISEDPEVTLLKGTHLKADRVEDAFQVSVDDLPEDIDRDNEFIVNKFNGSHNDRKYLAYTFYAKNEGIDTIRYRSEISVGNKTESIYDILRVALYVDGTRSVYANETNLEAYYNDDNNQRVRQTKECIGSYSYDEENQTYVCSGATREENNAFAIPFESDTRVMRNENLYLTPSQITRFTVVIWIEGDDPDCVGELVEGAGIALEMRLAVIETVRDENA